VTTVRFTRRELSDVLKKIPDKVRRKLTAGKQAPGKPPRPLGPDPDGDEADVFQIFWSRLGVSRQAPVEEEKMEKAKPEVANTATVQRSQHHRGAPHSETHRIQRLVASTPGSGRQQFEAGKAEQRRIENERARGR